MRAIRKLVYHASYKRKASREYIPGTSSPPDTHTQTDVSTVQAEQGTNFGTH